MEQSDLDLLQTVPPYHLQSLVRSRHLPLPSRGQNLNTVSTATASTMSEIAQYLFASSNITEAIHSLNDGEMLILRELAACGGRANSRDLALYLMKSGKLNSSKGLESLPLSDRSSGLYPVAHPHGAFEQALHHLLLLGLLFWGKQTNFAGRDYTNGVYDGVLIVPQAVREVVQEIVSQEGQQKEEQQPVHITIEDIEEGMCTFQRTLYLYWSHVASLREGLQLVSSGLLSRSTLRQVMELLNPPVRSEQARTEQDVPRLLFIRLLLTQLGLLQERDHTLRAVPAEDFFALSLLERVRRCFQAWLGTPFWNELAYLPDVVVRPGPAPLEPAHEEAVRARQMVMERLLHEQPGSWQDISTFIARSKLYVPYLLFPRSYGSRADRYSIGSNPYGWDFRLRHGWLTHREGWHFVEGGFIRSIISGPLHWLGLTEIDKEHSPSTFRLSQHISAIAGDASPVIEEATWGRLIVQPNFELVALAPVSEGLLVKLDRFAERIRLEHIAQYRLTRASITRAIQAGFYTDSILQVLREAAGEGAELPQNVQYSLVEWERQARRIEMWQDVTLLEVDDAALLDTLFSEEETRSMLGRRLSPVLAEVLPQHLPGLEGALWKRNYLPALAAAPAHDGLAEAGRLPERPPQWKLCDDGLLQPLYAVTDLYLAAEIGRISVYDEATGWRKITPASIQQACQAGISLSSITQFLQQYCEGGVPTSFLIRLKLWGGGYGAQASVHVEQAPILYLSEQVLQDIRADKEIQALLGDEVPSEGRLVRVPPEHLERVIFLLQERGFMVD